MTYQHTLLALTPNDGSAEVTLPDSETSNETTGTSVDLVIQSGNGGADSDDMVIMLDDEADTLVENGAPYSANVSYKPSNPLSDFDGLIA